MQLWTTQTGTPNHPSLISEEWLVQKGVWWFSSCVCVCLFLCRQILQAYAAATVSATVVAIGLNALAKVGSLALQWPFRELNLCMVFSRLHEIIWPSRDRFYLAFYLVCFHHDWIVYCVEMCAVKRRFSLRPYTWVSCVWGYLRSYILPVLAKSLQMMASPMWAIFVGTWELLICTDSNSRQGACWVLLLNNITCCVCHVRCMHAISRRAHGLPLSNL